MPSRRYRAAAVPQRLVSWCLLFAVIASAGCRPKDEIRTYRIAKPEGDDAVVAASAPVSTPLTPPAERGEPTHRLIGAMVAGPDRVWFFKSVGPIEPMESVAESIDPLLASVRFDSAEPAWDLPDGWTEKPGAGMRHATLVAPVAGGGETELTVTGLALADDWDSQVLDNMNRWLKQLGKPPVADAASVTKAIDGFAGRSAVIDTTGWFDGGTMAPFAGANRPPAATPPARPPARSELQYEKPAGWKDGPASSMRKASFETAGGASVTAFAFNAAGAMGDPVANVNRWRGEIGLEATDAETLASETEAMPLLGEEGSYFELVGEEETTYAAMVVRGGQAWFFKIRGKSDAVASEREAFRGWLKSLSL